MTTFVRIDDLRPGELFLFEGELFIKLSEHMEMKSGHHAVCVVSNSLLAGSGYRFDPITVVQRFLEE